MQKELIGVQAPQSSQNGNKSNIKLRIHDQTHVST